MSVEASRLDVSRASKAASNPSALMSSHAGIKISKRKRLAGDAFWGLIMAGENLGLTARANVPQFPFKTFDFKPHRGAAEEGEGHQSRRSVGFLKTHRKQVKRRRSVWWAEAGSGGPPPRDQTQPRSDALVPPRRGRAPVIAHRREDEA